MDRSRKPCIRDECPYPRHNKKLCAGHYLEAFPAKPRAAAPAKPRKPIARKPVERKPGEWKPVARTPLARTPMKSASGKPRSAPRARKPSKAGEIPDEVRAIVLDRCGGLCEACGRPLRREGAHLHHRLRRRDGGHTPDNLVALHSECHVVAPKSVHQNPTWARERGLIVPSWGNPATQPLTLATGRLVLLHPTQAIYLDPPDDLLLAA